ncbi:anti-sigma factor family protein [Paraburkholderia acidisoli]|uniref:Anti-sigma factor n=1 Tax=Paraburkholderia acidisoli TaxID=2571748 RepID=A0A7Z2JH60_9BURK|nr:anti-sigma factor [Paraburkholderia acidisoli]QGZ62915.1 anti-sigma factor [Paraburkholderia acidisoli]
MLGAYVDDELPPPERAAVYARLAADPQAAARVAAWRTQKAALQMLCEGLRVPGDSSPGGPSREPDEPPAVLVLRAREPWWWRAGVAASWMAAGAGVVVLAAALLPRLAPDAAQGLLARAPHSTPGRTPLAEMAAAPDTPDTPEAFARRADVAYAVYSPEQRHPVEVAASDETHLVAWLSKRLGKPLSVPSLAEYGYALVGGRLLPGNAEPAAQFMYENDAGERLTLYVGRSGSDRDAVRLLRDGTRRTFYWSTQRTGYALSGPQTEPKLREIALDVCSALGGQPGQW